MGRKVCLQTSDRSGRRLQRPCCPLTRPLPPHLDPSPTDNSQNQLPGGFALGSIPTHTTPFAVWFIVPGRLPDGGVPAEGVPLRRLGRDVMVVAAEVFAGQESLSAVEG